MSTNDPFVPESPAIERSTEPPVLTVFRSRREHMCEACGGMILVGSDYFRIGLGSFHRDCLPEDSRR